MKYFLFALLFFFDLKILSIILGVLVRSVFHAFWLWPSATLRASVAYNLVAAKGRAKKIRGL